MVIEANPIRDHMAGVLQGLEPVAMIALIFEGSDDPLDHAVLFAAVGRDELLTQTIVFDESSVASAGEHETVIGSKQERRLDTAEMSVSSDQGRLSHGNPSFDVVVHLGAHRCFLSTITPEQEFTGSIQTSRGSRASTASGKNIILGLLNRGNCV